MQRSKEKLYKIFKLEAEFNYANKAVVGGLEKLTETWAGEARADGISEDDIQQITSILHQYPTLDIQKRMKSLKKIGVLLDIAGIKHLPPSKGQPNLTNEPEEPAESPKKVEGETPNKKKVRGSTRKRSNAPAPLPQEALPQGLQAPVTTVRGIGMKQSQLLAKLSLLTVEDMIYYFPHRYDDYSELKTIKDLTYGEEVTILAWVKSVKTFTTRNNKRKIIQAIVTDSTGAIQLMWFNQEYHMRYLKKDMIWDVS